MPTAKPTSTHDLQAFKPPLPTAQLPQPKPKPSATASEPPPHVIIVLPLDTVNSLDTPTSSAASQPKASAGFTTSVHHQIYSSDSKTSQKYVLSSQSPSDYDAQIRRRNNHIAAVNTAEELLVAATAASIFLFFIAFPFTLFSKDDSSIHHISTNMAVLSGKLTLLTLLLRPILCIFRHCISSPLPPPPPQKYTFSKTQALKKSI